MNRKRIVVTGGTRGIGLGLTQEFLALGHQVCITGRSHESVDRALTRLPHVDADCLTGLPCDAGELSQVQDVWEKAVARFGEIDIWINNAGVANHVCDFEQLDHAEYRNVVNTNLIGIMHACKVCLVGMARQGHGQIYNFEGFGSNGMISPGFSVYGSTKRALTYFTDTLIKENKDKPVNIGFLSPGIVITDMILQEASEMSPERWERTRRMYNILGDDVDTVTVFLAEETLKDFGNHGSRIEWLTRGRAASRFFGAFVLRRQRDLISQYGV